jgi:REP element-mobilizing transposase RayT
MARPLRIEYSGAVYHVISRGNRRGAIFPKEEDKALFLSVLAATVERFRVLCHAYCLMGNHYHLILETPDGNLSRAMRHLNGVYTQLFNRDHDKCGHVFQGRYSAILIQRDAHLLEACRYIVLNPIRAGLAAGPQEWRWSSYRAAAGLETGTKFLTSSWILSQFGGDIKEARERYARFVAEGCDARIWNGLVSGLVLGSAEFAGRCRGLAHMDGDRSEIPRLQHCAPRPSLAEILAGPGDNTERWLRAVDVFGYTQKEVAEGTGVHYSYVSRLLKLKRSKVKT